MLKLIMPMAGNGQRFFDAGYDLPKPLIDVKGKPMFVRVLENIKYGTDIHVIVRKDHIEQYNIDTKIKEHCPEATVHVINEPNEGACCTVLEAVDPDSDAPFLVANCDQLMVWDKKKFYTPGGNYPGVAGGTIMTFYPNHDKPIHSYVKLDITGRYVIQLAEKEMISNIATTGVYHFGSQKKFVQAANHMMKMNDRTNNEFYLAPVYNYILEPVKVYMVDEFIGMGTPEELKATLERDLPE